MKEMFIKMEVHTVNLMLFRCDMLQVSEIVGH